MLEEKKKLISGKNFRLNFQNKDMKSKKKSVLFFYIG